MRSRPFSWILVLSLAALFVGAALPPGAAQDVHESRLQTLAPMTFGMSGTQKEGDAPPEAGTGTTYELTQESTTPARLAPECNTENAGTTRDLAGWVSEPLSDTHDLTFVGSTTVTFQFLPGTTQTIPGAGQPLMTSGGPLRLVLYMTGGGHPLAQASYEVPAPATPVAPIPGPAEFNLTFEGHPVPVNEPLVFRLTINCPVADFDLQSDPEFTAERILGGNPTEADTDGDGIPDSQDDDADGDGHTDSIEAQYGTSPTDAGDHPALDRDGDGFTIQQEADAGTSDDNADDFPGAGGFPWGILALVLLALILVIGGVFALLTVANRKIKMTVSHDGFQAIEKGQVAEYELTLMATGKKEEAVPVELSLKGVPEDWSAVLEPSHLTLFAGEAAEAQTVALRLIPPPEEQYESEAQVTVTATPTDDEGKTKATKPGTSVKTKTIVNIGMVPPEEEGKKRKTRKAPKEDATESEPGEAGAAEAEPKKKKSFLKRKKAAEEEGAEAGAAEGAAAGASAGAAAGAASAAVTQGKPQIAMGKMVHDPADFSAGDEVTTTVSVRNKGDEPVSGLRLSLFVNDERADQQDVDLAPGESRDVLFKWTAQPDENRVRIKGGLKGA